MNGRTCYVVAALAAAVLAFGAVAGHGGRGAEAQEHGGPVVLTVHSGICLAVVSGAPGFTAFDAVRCLSLQIPDRLQRIAQLLGWDGEGHIAPEIFEPLAIAGNQVRQMDGHAQVNGTLFFLAFVEQQAPVTFSTTEGTIWPRGQQVPDLPTNPELDPAGSFWVCDDAQTEDPDCVNGAGGADGVVVARLVGRWGDDVPDRGAATMSVSQAGLGLDVPFTVVGAPETVEFHRLKSSVEIGIADPAADCAVAPPHEGPLQESLMEADATAERALVVGIARDGDGTAVTGAFLTWETDDADRAVLAAPLAPTVDLGPLGYGAPNVLCALETPGTVTVRAQIVRVLPDLFAIVDPLAIENEGTVAFEVVEPAQESEHPCETLPSRASPRARANMPERAGSCPPGMSPPPGLAGGGPGPR